MRAPKAVSRRPHAKYGSLARYREASGIQHRGHLVGVRPGAGVRATTHASTPAAPARRAARAAAASVAPVVITSSTIAI
jgi:hypothetical protein